MYFLDTNTLYWYYGREKLNLSSGDKIDCEKLCSFLDRADKKVLASSAFIEAVVHFRNDVDLLRGLIDFIKEKDLRLYNNVPYYGLGENVYSYILNANKLDLKKYADNLLKEKIRIESKFATAFLCIMTLLYLHHRLVEEKVPARMCEGLESFVGSRNTETIEKKIYNELESGYRENIEEKKLKEVYLGLLEEDYLFMNSLIAIANEINDSKVDLIKEIRKVNLEYEKDKSNYCVKTNQNNYLMERIKNELSANSVFISSAKTRIAEMFSRREYNGKKIFIQAQSEYIKETMFDAWIDRAKKIEKNDIFDMFFIGCYSYVGKAETVIEDTNTYLLSFDNAIKKYIEKHRRANIEKINQFYIS